MKYIILLAPNWNYTEGGVNSFNFDFALSLGIATANTLYKVVCITYKPADQKLVEKAIKNHVIIESLGISRGDLGIAHIPQITTVLSKFDDAKFFYFIGHDALTGPLANMLKQDLRYSSCSVVFHHMDYESYYAIKGDNSPDDMDNKFLSQTEILKSADHVVGIGPKLKRSALNKVGEASKVHMLIPGLQNITPNQHISKLSAITFGRYDLRNDRLKQMALAAKAFVEFVDELPGDERRDATLKVIGISEDQERKDFLAKATEGVASYVNIVTLPYSTDRNGLFDYLVSSNVCLMLSVHEGFGLVGWEAIAAGVPLIVSGNTGVFEFLKNEFPGESLTDYGIIPCFIGGSMNGMVNDDDKEAVKTAFGSALYKGAFYKEGILKLRNILLNKYNWQQCAASFLAILDGIGNKPATSKSLEEVLFERKQVISRLNKENRPQPLLELSVRPDASDLTYISRSIDFSGRKKELDQLLAFCASGSKISWWTITGEGGSGKSRIALELLLDLVGTKGWYGGFLSTAVMEQFDWKEWVPAFDTILVIDYAARFFDKIQAFFSDIGLAAEFSSKKIRVLLLERNVMGDWWRSLVYFQEQGKVIRPYDKHSIFLSSLADEVLIDLIGNYKYFNKLGKTKGEVLAKLKKSPKYNIPLYAMMLLQNLCYSGSNSSAGSSVFASFIQREDREVWQKLFPDATTRKKHKNLVAFITIAGGVAVKALPGRKLNSLFPDNINTDIFHSLNLLSHDRLRIYPVEPDLLGEHFVVENFINENNLLQIDPDFLPIIDTAWKHAPQNVLSFFQRIIYDFPGLPFSQVLIYPAKKASREHVKAWCSLQGDLLAVTCKKDGVGDSELRAMYTQLEKVAVAEAGLEQYAIGALIKIIAVAMRNQNGKNAGYYKDRLKALLFRFPDREHILSVGYFYFNIGKISADELEIDQAEECVEKLSELKSVDSSVFSEKLSEKLQADIDSAKYRKTNIDFANGFDFSHKVQVNEHNILQYEDEAKALVVQVQISINDDRMQDVVHFFGRLKEIAGHAPAANRIMFLQYQQYAATYIIKFKLLAGELHEELIREHNQLAFDHYPQELAREGIVFWHSNFGKFLRANPEVEAILAQLAPILQVDDLPRGTWNFYWGCLLEILQFHFENNEVEKALECFQSLQQMFVYPEKKQDPATASEAAIRLSVFFREDPKNAGSRQYYDLAKQYSRVAGTHFDLAYALLSLREKG
jgi:glycosyltransferase involved in cell wall biosynthesis